MKFSRREFSAGAMALTAAGALSGRASAQVASALSPQARAFAAIEDYAEAHRSWFGLPGLTFGVTSPSGFSSVASVGFADIGTRAPITPDTLFQIGSISKSFTSAMLHQFAAEGRLNLADRIVSILPGAPLPADCPVEVQHILDHVAGIPGDSPLFVPGGLWTAYAAGAHWHYSNTGYLLLGHLAQHIGGKPLDRLLEERLLGPLGMSRTRGAILAADRPLYAQGYGPPDLSVPFVRGSPLAPTAWIDTTDAAGSIASTAADMLHYVQALASAAQGRGGMGLQPQAALAYVGHNVPSDSNDMAYGNGLMHVESGGRNYLHHTGGMVSFSSSFHVDIASGIGAFASSNFSAFPEYRPRKLTLFAVQAIAAAEAGLRVPDPPPLEMPPDRPSDYGGRYRSGQRIVEIRSTPALSILSGGREASLQQAGDDVFATAHPDFRTFTLLFERQNDRIVGLSWGPDTFVREGASVSVAPSDPELARLAGRYVNDSPWVGTTRIVERSGKLWIGTETPLTRIGENLWRPGKDDWSPERAAFADFLGGSAQTFIYSGEKFARQDS